MNESKILNKDRKKWGRNDFHNILKELSPQR